MKYYNELPESLKVAIGSRLRPRNLASLAQTSTSSHAVATAVRDMRSHRIETAKKVLRANARIAKIQAGRSQVQHVVGAILQSFRARNATSSHLRRAGFKVSEHANELVAHKVLNLGHGAKIETTIWQAIPKSDNVTSDVTVYADNREVANFSGRDYAGTYQVVAEDVRGLGVFETALIQQMLKRDNIPLLVRVGREYREFGSSTPWR